jgi:hypothetical protein
MLFGTLVNRVERVLRLRAAQVRVLDRNGRPLPAAAVFSGGGRDTELAPRASLVA